MSTSYRVALLGFSDFERNALGSCFRLALQRRPGYEAVEALAEADFVVVDADHVQALHSVIAGGRVGDTVFVGASPPQGGSAWTMRPIDPVHVLRELDTMALQRGAVPASAPRSGARPHAAGPARRADDAATRPARRPQAHPPGRATAAAAALLIDDSEVALRHLEQRLQRYGLRTQRALNSSQALALLAQRAFDFVFLDVELGEDSNLDGLALCRYLKRDHARPVGALAPVVIMVTTHDREVDRVRGALAGCDAYLGKPLDDDRLQHVLLQHGVTLPALTAAARPASAPVA
jgi:CheY-like chemotaxis protein